MDSFLRYMDPDVDGVVTLEELHMGMRRARMDEKTLKEEQRAGGIMLRLEAIMSGNQGSASASKDKTKGKGKGKDNPRKAAGGKGGKEGGGDDDNEGGAAVDAGVMRVRNLFDILDEDKSGEITCAELRRGLVKLTDRAAGKHTGEVLAKHRARQKRLKEDDLAERTAAR